jgi:hypothetical protein
MMIYHETGIATDEFVRSGAGQAAEDKNGRKRRDGEVGTGHLLAGARSHEVYVLDNKAIERLRGCGAPEFNLQCITPLEAPREANR